MGMMEKCVASILLHHHQWSYWHKAPTVEQNLMHMLNFYLVSSPIDFRGVNLCVCEFWGVQGLNLE